MFYPQNHKGIKPPFGVRLNDFHPLALGLVACWLFSEGMGNWVFDLSKYGNIGTLVNGAMWALGRTGWALKFDGNDNHITLSDFNYIGGSFTISAWIKTTSTTGTYRVIFASSLNDTWWYPLIIIRRAPDGNAEFGIYETISNGIVLTGPQINDGIWHYVVVVRNKDTNMVYLYVDGLLAASGPFTGDMTTAVENFIGKRHSGPATTHWEGLIGEMMIWKRVLFNSEISQLFFDPYAMFTSYPVTLGALPFAPDLTILDFERGIRRGVVPGIMRGIC